MVSSFYIILSNIFTKSFNPFYATPFNGTKQTYARPKFLPKPTFSFTGIEVVTNRHIPRSAYTRPTNPLWEETYFVNVHSVLFDFSLGTEEALSLMDGGGGGGRCRCSIGGATSYLQQQQRRWVGFSFHRCERLPALGEVVAFRWSTKLLIGVGSTIAELGVLRLAGRLPKPKLSGQEKFSSVTKASEDKWKLLFLQRGRIAVLTILSSECVLNGRLANKGIFFYKTRYCLFGT